MTKADKHMGLTSANARRREPVPEPPKYPPQRKLQKKPWRLIHAWRRRPYAHGDHPVFASEWAYGKYTNEALALVNWRRQVRRYHGMFKDYGWDARGEWWIVQPDGTAYTPIE